MCTFFNKLALNVTNILMTLLPTFNSGFISTVSKSTFVNCTVNFYLTMSMDKKKKGLANPHSTTHIS